MKEIKVNEKEVNANVKANEVNTQATPQAQENVVAEPTTQASVTDMHVGLAESAKEVYAKVTKEEVTALLESHARNLTVAQLIYFDENIKSRHFAQRRNDSHDNKFIIDLVNSIRKGWKIGTITIAFDTDKHEWLTQDGQSRTNSIRRALNGEIDGLELTESDKVHILNSVVDVTYYEYDTETLGILFEKINKSKPLSALQKNKGLLAKSSQAESMDTLANHKVWSIIFTPKQVSTEEPLACMQLIFANILDCYTATNPKLVKALAETDRIVDVDLLKDILDKIASSMNDFEETERRIPKYAIIHFVVQCYKTNCTFAPMVKAGKRDTRKQTHINYDFTINDIDSDLIFATAMSVHFPTTGANSVPQNTERTTKMLYAFGDYFNEKVKEEGTAKQNGVVSASQLLA